MKISNTSLSGVLIIEPRVFHDERGYFFESFNEKNFKENIIQTSLLNKIISQDLLKGFYGVCTIKKHLLPRENWLDALQGRFLM